MYPPYHLYVGDLAFWDLKVFICFLKGPYLGNIKVFFLMQLFYAKETLHSFQWPLGGN